MDHAPDGLFQAEELAHTRCSQSTCSGGACDNLYPS
jgi:hypothetical protein